MKAGKEAELLEAAKRAHDLAFELAERVRCQSAVPIEHWDEVLERLTEIMSVHASASEE